MRKVFSLIAAVAVALPVTASAMFGAAALAHEGHDHGLAGTVVSQVAAPRGTASSDVFEVVAAAADGRLVVYVDRFATNEPVSGATVEVIENDQPTKAVQTAPGIYAISGWTRPPGAYPLMVSIEAGADSDLLPIAIEIPTPEVPSSAGYATLWIVIGQTATVAVLAFALLLIYMRATRRYDHLLDAGARLSPTALLLSTTRPQAIVSMRTRRLGPALVAERLWESTGCRAVIADAAASQRFDFPVERTIYAAVAQRLFDAEPNRPVREWLEANAVSHTDRLADRHADIAMAWLGAKVDESTGDDAYAGRTTKDLIEERLFAQRANAQAGLDLVFFNTLPVAVETRAKGKARAKAPRPAASMAVGVVLDAEHRPICCELWPGGAVDVEALLPAIDRLRARFDIQRVCLVADLRLTKPETVQSFNDRGIEFILGLRDDDADLRKRLLEHGSPLEPMALPHSHGRHGEIAVKEVASDEIGAHAKERFIVCSEKPFDLADRPSVGTDGDPADGDRIGTAAPHYFALRTNTKLSPATVVERYHQLTVVEDVFRAARAILDVQPSPGARHAVVRGQVFCSFLALVLRRDLEEKLLTAGLTLTWGEVVGDLNRLLETELVQDGRHFVLRNGPDDATDTLLETMGVALPPPVERRVMGNGSSRDAAIQEDALLPERLRRGAIRLSASAVANAERNVRALGDWIGRHP